MNDLIKIQKTNLKWIHIMVLILGTIFISLSIFHQNLWFDESYSVGIANHSFKDIWLIGSNDVHPVLYYCLLHILNLIFGNNILIYRLFSAVCVSLLGIIGFTHIRKDFGEKIGLIFSFLVFFFPVQIVYAGEIRMYTLAMLLVTLTAIYAYRIYKNKENFNIKNWIIFAICSLASAYTHYYALMASGLINLFLMIYLIKKCIKTKEFNKNMKAFIISAISQVVLYMPWLISLFIQLNHVSSGFWIGFTFPDSIIELFIFIFTGNLSGSTYLSPTLAIIWSLSVIIYMAVLYIKDIKKSKENNLNSTVNPAILALSLFLGVALAAGIISIVMGTPIIYARYLLCVMGLFIFFLSYTMIKKGQKYITLIICIASMLISLHINIDLINENYDESNCKPVQFVEEAIQENDIILVENDLNGFIILVNFNNNPAYFYDKENWNCGEAYKAFSKDFTTIQDLEFLKDYTGRIWTINSNNNFLYEQLKEKYDVNLIKQETFDVKYKNLEYSISLIEKN